MSDRLTEDLKRYAAEVYTKRDVKAGMKIVAEVAGLVSLGLTASAALGFVLNPLVGAGTAAVVTRHVLMRLGRQYMSMDEDERKQVRAAVAFLSHGFRLGDRLVG